MGEFYENYNRPPENNPDYKDSGTAPLVLGICSLICALTFSRLAGLVLGIIAVCISSSIRKENPHAEAGFILGIIGICVSIVFSGIILLSVLFPLILLF